MTPIVSVLSEKGGVAKTATVEGLAAAALAPPRRILAIDLDPRHSLSVGLGFADCYDERGRLREDGGLFSVNDLLAEDGADGRATTAVATSPWGDTIGVLLAERPLGLREADGSDGLEYRLKSSLLGVTDRYDLVLIDCPPRPGGVLIRAALLASTHVLLVTTPDASGLEGVRDSLRTIDTLRRFQHPRLQIAGVLRTIAPPNEGEARRANEELHTTFAHLVLPLAVPRLSVHKRAHAASAPLGAYRGPEAQRLLAVYQQTLHQLLNGTESTHA